MDDKENQKDQQDKIKDQQRIIAEKIKADIMADDELVTMFLLPKFYNLIDNALYKQVGYKFYEEMQIQVARDKATFEEYKKELAEVLDYDYINRVINIYTCMAYIEARRFIYLFIATLYDISQIKDDKIKRQKLTEVKMYCNDNTKLYTNIKTLLTRAMAHQKTILNGAPEKVWKNIADFENLLETSLLDYGNDLQNEEESQKPLSYLKSNVFISNYLCTITDIYTEFIAYLLNSETANFTKYAELLDNGKIEQLETYPNEHTIEEYEARKDIIYRKYAEYWK